jgi:hypothetical protein
MSAAEEAGRRSPSAGPEGGAGAGARASLAARAGDRCRVCQEDVALDDGARGGSKEEEVIMPGCACRSPCHRACMEAWTRHKGDRTCELCGEVFANLPDPPPPPPSARRGGEAREDFTVVMRPLGPDAGERVVIITQSEADGEGRVTIRRYYSSGGAEEGLDPESLRAPARGENGWLSEGVYLLVFIALFIILFGAPGLVLGCMYAFWYVWLRGVAG